MIRTPKILEEKPGERPFCLLIGLVILLAAGCAGPSSRPAVMPSDDAPPRAQSAPPAAAAAETEDSHDTLEQRLRSEVRLWKGTSHRMGGTTRDGIDCSGFVQRLYRDIFGRRIARSTYLQVRSGRPIDRNQLQTGDLVFFRIPYKGAHVGIYLSRSEFAHASSSKGVTISNIEDHYWNRSYWTARRYLDASK